VLEVRRYIFTDRERKLLRGWMETGEESQGTMNVLSWIRQGFPLLAEDMDLLFKAIRTMQRRHVWRGYATRRSEFGSALRRARSSLNRVRGGATASTASNG
jgi:hypothetical protein